jgi:hypothetical protein
MTLRTPPSWLQNGSHPAENDRLTTQALWATTGIIKSDSLAVTQNSPAGMSVLVSSGWAAIVGTTQSNMGTYVGYNDATVVLSLTTANPTNPRIDRVCLTVNDAYYTGALNNAVLQVVAGTPAGSPVAPALPANSISLATVAVGAGVTSITTANITDTRTVTTTNVPQQISANQVFISPEERCTVSATAATGTIAFNIATQGVLYYTTNASANFTLNFTNVNTNLAVGDSVSCVFLNTNGATPYYASAFQIDGSAVTPKWVGGTAPSSGNASSIDSYSFTIIKTAATPTYTVLAGGATKFA